MLSLDTSMKVSTGTSLLRAHWASQAYGVYYERSSGDTRKAAAIRHAAGFDARAARRKADAAAAHARVHFNATLWRNVFGATVNIHAEVRCAWRGAPHETPRISLLLRPLVFEQPTFPSNHYRGNVQPNETIRVTGITTLETASPHPGRDDTEVHWLHVEGFHPEDPAAPHEGYVYDKFPLNGRRVFERVALDELADTHDGDLGVAGAVARAEAAARADAALVLMEDACDAATVEASCWRDESAAVLLAAATATAPPPLRNTDVAESAAAAAALAAARATIATLETERTRLDANTDTDDADWLDAQRAARAAAAAAAAQNAALRGEYNAALAELARTAALLDARVAAEAEAVSGLEHASQESAEVAARERAEAARLAASLAEAEAQRAAARAEVSKLQAALDACIEDARAAPRTAPAAGEALAAVLGQRVRQVHVPGAALSSRRDPAASTDANRSPVRVAVPPPVGSPPKEAGPRLQAAGDAGVEAGAIVLNDRLSPTETEAWAASEARSKRELLLFLRRVAPSDFLQRHDLGDLAGAVATDDAARDAELAQRAIERSEEGAVRRASVALVRASAAMPRVAGADVGSGSADAGAAAAAASADEFLALRKPREGAAKHRRAQTAPMELAYRAVGRRVSARAHVEERERSLETGLARRSAFIREMRATPPSLPRVLANERARAYFAQFVRANLDDTLLNFYEAATDYAARAKRAAARVPIHLSPSKAKAQEQEQRASRLSAFTTARTIVAHFLEPDKADTIDLDPTLTAFVIAQVAAADYNTSLSPSLFDRLQAKVRAASSLLLFGTIMGLFCLHHSFVCSIL